MNFSELESLMSTRGVTTLADIARALNTTPQAVSNWKSRNQTHPHRNQLYPPKEGPVHLCHGHFSTVINYIFNVSN